MTQALKRYSPQDVQRILGRALNQESTGDVSLEELNETARELGISDSALQRAVGEHEAGRALEQARGDFVRLSRQRLARHAATFTAINVGMFVLDFVGDGRLSFAPIVAAAWGIGLLASAARTLFLTHEDLDRGAEKLVRRQERLLKRLSRSKD